MGKPPAIQHEDPPGFDPHVVLIPARHNPVPPLPAASECRRPAAPLARVKPRAVHGVVILEAAGRLSDVVKELDDAIQLALAGEPRGVICDLSDVFEVGEPASLQILATTGRHVRDWPGVCVAVACEDPHVAQALHADPLGAHLIVQQSLFTAVTSVLSSPTLDVRRLQLTPHPSAPRAARNFLTRTLLDWQLSRVIPFASLVVSELVESSSIHAGTDIDLAVAWDRGRLRLTVADHAPAVGGQSHSNLQLYARTQTVLAALTSGFWVLPTADGGKVVWAVLEAPRRNLSDSNGTTAPTPPPQRDVSAKEIRIALDTIASNSGRSAAEVARTLTRQQLPASPDDEVSHHPAPVGRYPS